MLDQVSVQQDVAGNRGAARQLVRWAIGMLLCAQTGLAHAAAPEACQDLDAPASLSTLCGFAKPEDVQFIASRAVLIVSEQGWETPSSGGAIASVPVDTRKVRLGPKRKLWPRTGARAPTRVSGDPSCTTPPLEVFAPHGLSVLEQPGSVRLAIMNHAGREAVELFDIREERAGLVLDWLGCIPLPSETAGNDVAWHADGRVFVTNYVPTLQPPRTYFSIVAALRGEITGDVLEWTPSNGWRHLPNTAGAMPNGIIVDAAGRTLYVSELGKQRVNRFRLQSDGGVERAGEFAFRDMPDNLNWTARGTILVAGQTRTDAKQWSAAEIDPQTGSVRPLFEGQNAIHSVTSATDIGSAIVFGSTGDQKIAIAKWPR